MAYKLENKVILNKQLNTQLFFVAGIIRTLKFTKLKY